MTDCRTPAYNIGAELEVEALDRELLNRGGLSNGDEVSSLCFVSYGQGTCL